MNNDTGLEDFDVERVLIGSIIREPDSIPLAVEVLRPDHFGNRKNELVYRAILDLYTNGVPVDLISIKKSLEKAENFDAVGAQALSSYMVGVPIVRNASAWAKIIHDTATKRKIGAAADRVKSKSGDAAIESGELIEAAFNEFMTIADSSIVGTFAQPEDAIEDAYKELQAMALNDDVVGVASGLDGLDALTGGFKPGDLVIIGARPSNGKTSFAINIADECAKTNGIVLFFSLEMSTKQLNMRRICSDAMVSTSQLRGAYNNEDLLSKVRASCDRLTKRPIHIDDTFDTTVSQIRAKSRKAKHQHGRVDMIVVDYIQLIRGDGAVEKHNREREVASISRALKGLAKDMGVPVVALSQLNRGFLQTESQRPGLDSLRESGAIEQDADTVIFLHRSDKLQGSMEIILAKQRNGPTGNVFVNFLADYTKFSNYVPAETEHEAEERGSGNSGRKARKYDWS